MNLTAPIFFGFEQFLFARGSYLPTDEALALFQNWMDDPNDVELTVSKSTADSVNRDDISIKDLDPAIELTYYRPHPLGMGFSRNSSKNLIKKDANGRFTVCQETTDEADRHIEEDFFVTLEGEFRSDKLSEGRVEFRKTKHSVMLTEWLFENNPEHFAKLAQFLKDILNKDKAAVR